MVVEGVVEATVVVLEWVILSHGGSRHAFRAGGRGVVHQMQGNDPLARVEEESCEMMGTGYSQCFMEQFFTCKGFLDMGKPEALS